MNLTENPIFLTQKRLVHRSGVLAPVLITLLIGLCLLAGLLFSISNSHLNRSYSWTPLRYGKVYYTWLLVGQALVLIFGGLNRIAQTLYHERKAGLWDSNRLTPLKPSELVLGYWLGSPLREVYMGAALSAVGLGIIVISGLPITLWLGTQLLVLAATLMLSLLGVLLGLVAQRAQSGIALVALVPIVISFTSMGGRYTLTNFLLPVYPMIYLFSASDDSGRMWREFPQLFNSSIHPVLFALGVQLVVGIFLWRAAVRKSANPAHPMFPRGEAIALFAVFMALQHGLVWSIWQGAFGSAATPYRASEALSPVHCGVMLLGTFIVAAARRRPQEIRIEALRQKAPGFGWILSQSSITTALAITAVGALAMGTHFISARPERWLNFLIATANLLVVLGSFALVSEFCRLRFQSRSGGFVALGLVILWVLPFILGIVLLNSTFARVSFLSPGVEALRKPNDDLLETLATIAGTHVVVLLALSVLWYRAWKDFLDKNRRVSSP